MVYALKTVREAHLMPLLRHNFRISVLRIFENLNRSKKTEVVAQKIRIYRFFQLAIETIENVRTIQLLTRTTVFYTRYESASKDQKRSELAKGGSYREFLGLP